MQMSRKNKISLIGIAAVMGLMLLVGLLVQIPSDSTAKVSYDIEMLKRMVVIGAGGWFLVAWALHRIIRVAADPESASDSV